MNHAEIYLKAAEQLERGNSGCTEPGCGLSCCALSRFISSDHADWVAIQRPYAERFRDSFWWNGPNTTENRAARIAALREMAKLVKVPA